MSHSIFITFILGLLATSDLNAAQCNGKADIWFANDESGSVTSSEFDNALDFIYQVSDDLTFDSSSGLQAGITGWADAVNSEQIIIPVTGQFGDPGDRGLITDGNINTDSDGQGVRELYAAKASSTNGTRPDYATNYLADLITAGNGRRAGTPQIAVILTDATSSQLTDPNRGGGPAWSAELATLRASGPDGTKVIHMLIDVAADAYNNNTNDARTLIDGFVTSGDALFVGDTYEIITDPVQGYIDGLVNMICANTLPTVDIQGEPAVVNSLNPYQVTFAFSLDVTGFDVSGINVSNGSVSNVVPVNAFTYTADITPDCNCDITIDVPDGAAKSSAGNNSVAASQASTVFDNTPPTVAIQDAPAIVADTTPYTVIFEFNENVTGFVLGDISVGNGVASSFVTVDANTYTTTITPSAAGDVTIDVSAAVAQDIASNGNTAATQVITTFDNTPPTVDIQGEPVVVNNTSPYSVTFEFSEDVSGFELGDITVGNGTPSNLIGGPGTYTSTMTPTGTGNITIDMDMGGAQDVAGNDNTVAPQAFTVFDIIAPAVAITSAPIATLANQAAYPVSGTCTAGDGNVTVSILGAAPASQDVTCNAGSAWGANFDVSAIADGANVIDVNASQTDSAGNNGNAVLVEADKDASTPAVATTSAPLATAINQAAYPVSGTCSAGDGNVTVSIVDATPATQDVTCTAGGNWSASFDVSAIADGTNVIDVNASQTDDAGNTGNAVLVVADKDTVTVTVTILNAPAVTVAPYTVTFEFSTDVNGFIVGDIVVGNGSASNFVSVDGNTYIADITPDGNSDISIDVAANVVQDSSLNGNTAATQVITLLTTDADSDGIPDIIECPAGPPFDASCQDTDDDNFPDFQDLDSDNDGIEDRVEAAGNLNNPPDSDIDGTPDYLDLDSDNDGIPDHVEAGDDLNNPVDTDSDGTPEYLDLDSDNDGIPDAMEGGSTGLDTDDDGIDDAYDVDQTGGADANADGIDDNAVVDTDADGIPDFQDLDSDNDGIPDFLEGGATGTDIDGDGIDDAYDVDQTGGVDDNGDGIDDSAAVDTDDDGIPDAQDADSDNDGISDAIEGGAAGIDTDGDDIDDAYDVDQTGGIDANGDGIDDNAVIDTDGDGLPNSQDLDSDNDGLPDTVEGGSTTIDSDGDGIPDILENGSSSVDTDGDGIDDALDVDQTEGADANGDGIDDSVIDRDGDGVANYLDLDSDNDGIPDTFEAHSSGLDSNSNDIDDAFDFVLVGGIDANMDGIVDTLLDTDSDAIADVFDLDADADGINDLQESGLTPAKITSLDTDNNGVIESAVGANGLANVLETDDSLSAQLDQDGNGSADTPIDTDGDTHPDFQDLDADNDGIHDLVEGSGFAPAVVDSNKDGVIDDNGTDADSDGISDSIDSNNGQFGGLVNNPADTDGDLVVDFRDPDSDNDGIFDLFEGSGLNPVIVDADNNGVLDNPQTDTDNDGIPDSGDSFAGYGDSQATGPIDTDGDGVADFRDLDSDNDSITDVIEAGNQDDNVDGFLDPAGAVTVPPLDTDNDGTPDYVDLDSDNDGTLDIDDAGNGALDSNDDGMLDDPADVDADGIADSIDGDPGVPGLKADKDNDGINDAIDLDDDNDGIPDTAEADGNGNDVDTDGDGLIDRLDRDSDNDGLPDSVEAVQTVLDANADGIVDNFTDVNNDGLHDAVEAAMMPLDTDADSTPDFRDLDSDEDSLKDVFEAAGLSNVFDGNNDGMLDTQTDTDLDGLADVVDPDVTGGASGTVLSNPDTDGDHFSNYRDTDSDNDGVDDASELVDENGDGILDGLQEGDELKTAVRGIGSFTPFTMMLLLLPVLFRVRKSYSGLRVAALLVLVVSVFPVIAGDVNFCGRHNPIDSEDDADFTRCFYIGASWLAATHVDPEGTAFGWSTTDDSDAGYNIFAGWHFKPRWFGELSYADLGEAGLTNSNPNITGTENISYKIPALHVGYFLFAPEKQFNAYGKLGISSIRNKATTPNVPFDKQNSSGLSAGAGVQWRSLSNGLFARLAFDFYDRDARSIGLSLGYYFGDSEESNAVVTKVETDTDKDGLIDSLDVCPDSASGAKVDSKGCIIVAPIVKPEAVVAEFDTDADGIMDSADACPDSKKGVHVDTTGCNIVSLKQFYLTLEGVHFETNSARLTTGSKVILDNAVEVLKFSPSLRAEVQAHTDSRGSESGNLKLSDRRATSVRDYLISRGIAAGRLTAKGYGESTPKTTNETKDGRTMNRRVEFKILDEQQ